MQLQFLLALNSPRRAFSKPKYKRLPILHHIVTGRLNLSPARAKLAHTGLLNKDPPKGKMRLAAGCAQQWAASYN